MHSSCHFGEYISFPKICQVTWRSGNGAYVLSGVDAATLHLTPWKPVGFMMYCAAAE